MGRIVFALILMVVSNQITFSQYAIEGTITNENSTPIPDVFISVSKGNILIKNLVADSLGNYKIEQLEKGKYTLNYRHIAHKDSVITINLIKNAIVNLKFKDNVDLSTVVVTAKKSMIERKTDRLRFNVANSDLVIGSSVWEVINKTPFVSTSEEGAIEVAGTKGVIVYINNRKKQLSGVVLMNYLKSIPSDNLEAIEVITTPSSRFESEGGAGIINIVTKKNKEEGLVGTTTISARKTRLFSEAGSVYLNYRKSKWNLYSTTYISNRERKTTFEKNIFYPSSGTDIQTRFIDRENITKTLYSGTNLGIDYEMNKNHVLGVLFDYSGSDNKQNRNAESFDVYISNDSLTNTKNKDNQKDSNYSLNFNYQGKLGSKGEMLSVDADFLKFTSNTFGESKTQSLLLTNPDNVLYIRDWFRNTTLQKVTNKTIKLDLTLPLNSNLSIETGVKFSFSENHNDLKFENKTTDIQGWIDDTLRSNLFQYNENIYAIYALINYQINPKWSCQLGSRLENTIAKGWLENIKVVNRNYVNFFPTAFLKYSPSEKNSYVLSISSRITRPDFWDVNPFREYTTDKTYFEGNPFLNPSKYYRQEFNYTKNYGKIRFITQIGASQLFDEFYALPFNLEEDVIVNRKTNYGNKYAYFASTSLSTKLKPWWSINSSSLLGYIETIGSYATNNVVINSKTTLFDVSMNQMFVLSKEKGLSLTIYAKNTFPVTIVNTEIKNRLETELTLRKKMGNFNMSLSARDLFRSNKDRYTIQVDPIQIRDTNYHDTQSVALALQYTFGKTTVKNQRYRDTGNSDIQRRL